MNATEKAKWVTEAKNNVKAHESNILIALDKRNFSEADKLRGYVTNLITKIAEYS